jgi:dihydrofolate reductase
MTLSFVVAMSSNHVIGVNNKLPWRLPADLAYFRKLTMGHTILMGRKTYVSIGKPLEGRKNVVLTTNPDYEAPGCVIIHSVDEARQMSGPEELFVIGGAEIFNLLFDDADRLYVTMIEQEFAGDTFFPELDAVKWRLVAKEAGVTNEKNPYKYEFLVYERISVKS